jgi:hypothetical protein
MQSVSASSPGQLNLPINYPRIPERRLSLPMRIDLFVNSLNRLSENNIFWMF